MTTRQKGHTRLARDVRLGLRNLAGNEGVSPGSNRTIKIILRTTGTPRYFFNSCLRPSYMGYRPIQLVFEMPGEAFSAAEAAVVAEAADKAQILLAKTRYRR